MATTMEARLAAFLVRGRKMVEELASELDALEAAANGEPTAGQRAYQLTKVWSEKWARKYRTPYVVSNRTAAIAGLTKLIKALGEADLTARMDAYLASPDPFYKNARHPIEMFLKNVNKFSGTTMDDAEFMATPAVDCRHTPRCKSDQEHTRRRSAEVRA